MGVGPLALLVLFLSSCSLARKGDKSGQDPPLKETGRRTGRLVHPHPHPHLRHTALMMAPLKTFHPVPHSLNPRYLHHRKSTPTPRPPTPQPLTRQPPPRPQQQLTP